MFADLFAGLGEKFPPKQKIKKKKKVSRIGANSGKQRLFLFEARDGAVS